MKPVSPAIYARISRDRTRESLGVERQISRSSKEAAKRGWPEPTVYTDNDISASSGARRPGFERLLDDITHGRVDALIAWHLDRLLRRVLDLERVVKAIEQSPRDVQIVFLQAGEIDLSTASGRMLARILASVAAAESELKSERIAAQKHQEAHRGRPPSMLGYGWDANRVPVPEEADIIREVADRFLRGESVNSVANDLNNRGVPTPNAGRWDARRVAGLVKKGHRPEVSAIVEAARSLTGLSRKKAEALIEAAGGDPTGVDAMECLTEKNFEASDKDIAILLRDSGVPADPTAWRASALIAMITRASLCGWREYSPGRKGGMREMVAEGDWPPILSKDTVDALRERFRPGTQKADTSIKYMLAGVLKCGECGWGLTGGPTKYGFRYGCVHQPGRERCGKVSIAGPQVDRLVTHLMIDVLSDADVRAGAKRVGPSDEKIAAAEKELAEVGALREQIAAERADGDLTLGEWRSMRERLKARERAASKVLGTWSPKARNALTGIPTAREEIEEWWEAETPGRKREVITAFIDKIDIAPTNAQRGLNKFDATRVGEPVWLV